MARLSRKVYQRNLELDKQFHRCHEEGPKLHGYAWLKMNELMVNAAVA